MTERKSLQYNLYLSDLKTNISWFFTVPKFIWLGVQFSKKHLIYFNIYLALKFNKWKSYFHFVVRKKTKIWAILEILKNKRKIRYENYKGKSKLSFFPIFHIYIHIKIYILFIYIYMIYMYFRYCACPQRRPNTHYEH